MLGIISFKLHLAQSDLVIKYRRWQKKTDKLPSIKQFCDSIIEICRTPCSPVVDLIIHEKIESFRGKYTFQSIHNKPAKYGIEIFASVDSYMFYSLKVEIYCGFQPPGPCELSF